MLTQISHFIDLLLSFLSWLEFLSFVDRALPLPAPNIASSYSQSGDGRRGLETPPSRPVWETRQPLKGLSREGRYPSQDSGLGSKDVYDKQQNILGKKSSFYLQLFYATSVAHVQL